MDIQFYGGNCLTIATKRCRLVIDDNLKEMGGNEVVKNSDVALYTFEHHIPKAEPKLIIDGPGEYEVAGASIQGIALRSHIDPPGQNNATLYRIMADDLRIVVTGHIYPRLDDHLLETIGTVDILCLPVGGNGYTLDTDGALSVIREIEPKLVIPTHFSDKQLKFPVPQQELDDALKGLGMEPKATVAKLKVRPTDLSDVTQLVVLEKS